MAFLRMKELIGQRELGGTTAFVDILQSVRLTGAFLAFSIRLVSQAYLAARGSEPFHLDVLKSNVTDVSTYLVLDGVEEVNPSPSPRPGISHAQ
jgi:hypothetical protein